MGRGAVVFSWVHDAAMVSRAHRWHTSVAKGDDHLLPRTREQFSELLEAGQVVSAMRGDEFLGMTYYCRDEDAWELGGLMVSSAVRSLGIGRVLARVAIGHLLFDEEVVERGQTVVTHVHADNHLPRKLLTDGIGFGSPQSREYPGEKLPGLKQNAKGNVEGLLYTLDLDRALPLLRDWCASWSNELRNGESARIELGSAIQLKHWYLAFDEMRVTVSSRR